MEFDYRLYYFLSKVREKQLLNSIYLYRSVGKLIYWHKNIYECNDDILNLYCQANISSNFSQIEKKTDRVARIRKFSEYVSFRLNWLHNTSFLTVII